MGPRENPDTDRIADVRHGAGLDSGDAPGDLSPSAPGNANWGVPPAGMEHPGALLPASIGGPPVQNPEAQGPWQFPLAAEQAKGLAEGEQESTNAEPNLKGELGANGTPIAPSTSAGSSGPLRDLPRKPLHHYAGKSGAYGGQLTNSSQEHVAAGSASQDLHFRGNGSPGAEVWQERLQLRTLPNGSVLLVVQLETPNAVDGRPFSSNEAATVAEQSKDEDQSEDSLSRRQRIKQVAAPLLPALQQTFAQAAKEGAKKELHQKVRSWVRQRPGGMQLVANLDESSLRQLAVTLGPRYPQIRKLLEALR